MKFVSVREFSRSPSRFISESASGEDIVITKNGHPVVVVSELSENDIEDFVLAKHFHLEREFQRALAESQRGETVELDELVTEK